MDQVPSRQLDDWSAAERQPVRQLQRIAIQWPCSGTNYTIEVRAAAERPATAIGGAQLAARIVRNQRQAVEMEGMINEREKLEYTGEFVLKLPTGEIVNVQVKDIFGHSFPMPPQDYWKRNINPPIEELPVKFSC